MVPAFSISCCNLIDRWIKLVGSQESYELDISPELQNLSADVIARAAFGSTIEEGKQIFELQKEQVVLVIEAAQAIYIPGLRSEFNYFLHQNVTFTKKIMSADQFLCKCVCNPDLYLQKRTRGDTR